MVTGVETSGMVLAAFPLIVDGLGHYVNGLRTIEYWRRYHRELNNYVRRIKSQKVQYINTLELLFDGIVESEEELAVLVNDPVGISWQNEKHERRLGRRLDHCYKHFLDILKSMIETLKATGAKLGIDSSGKVDPCALSSKP